MLLRTAFGVAQLDGALAACPLEHRVTCRILLQATAAVRKKPGLSASIGGEDDMRTLFLSLCAVVIASSLPAQESAAEKKLSTASDARKLADQAMNFVRQEKFAEAYGVVKPFWPLPEIEIDGLANQMNTQWPMIQQRFGKSITTEFIGERKVGESFIQHTYLHKFERHALRWTFVFYKPADHWLVNAVSWDDGVEHLFE
jgi:hypothetical protein